MAKENDSGKKSTKGITADKEEDFGEWFSQVITKAELVDYTEVSGCYVYRPDSYEIWETVKQFLDKEFKKFGVRNAYFPLFIPEKLLNREKEHVAGFTPEVAWVTHTGNSKLAERLAIRPTSEAIMYESYKNWVKSWRDLPLKINQWCNVVRWEFKNPVPFIRSREFLWQEGHTVHPTKESADTEVRDILDVYKKAYKEMYAIPVIQGLKTDSEKFAGADYTTTCEVFLPNGKAAQGCTSHALGQNFAKAFGISFLDKEGKKQLPWQNSWGFTTRTIGLMIGMHSDNKGLVLPPAVASSQVVIIPILFEDSKEKVLKIAEDIKNSISDTRVFLDDNEGYSPGWKFHQWELKGIPVRIEIGPKDIENGAVIVARRDTGEKESVKIKELAKKIPALLKDIQNNLYAAALKFREDNTIKVTDETELVDAIKKKKLVRAGWCASEDCEALVKDKTGGAKVLCIPFDEKPSGKCVLCGKNAKHEVYIAKSY